MHPGAEITGLGMSLLTGMKVYLLKGLQQCLLRASLSHQYSNICSLHKKMKKYDGNRLVHWYSLARISLYWKQELSVLDFSVLLLVDCMDIECMLYHSMSWDTTPSFHVFFG